MCYTIYRVSFNLKGENKNGINYRLDYNYDNMGYAFYYGNSKTKRKVCKHRFTVGTNSSKTFSVKAKSLSQ